jgi:hypothetical protein
MEKTEVESLGQVYFEAHLLTNLRLKGKKHQNSVKARSGAGEKC